MDLPQSKKESDVELTYLQRNKFLRKVCQQQELRKGFESFRGVINQKDFFTQDEIKFLGKDRVLKELQ